MTTRARKKSAAKAQKALTSTADSHLEIEITSSDASRLLGISQRRIQQLVGDGFIPQGAKRGFYSLKGLVQGYLHFLRDEAARRTQVAGETDLKRARAREIELRIARQDRTIIERAEAEAMADQLCGLFLTCLSGLPARITRDISERQAIEKTIVEERERLNWHFDEIIAALETGEGSDQTGRHSHTG